MGATNRADLLKVWRFAPNISCQGASRRYGVAGAKHLVMVPDLPMASDLRSLISSFLQSMTHAALDEEPVRIAGLQVPKGEGLSKAQRIALPLDDLTELELARLASRFAAAKGDVPMDEAAQSAGGGRTRPESYYPARRRPCVWRRPSWEKPTCWRWWDGISSFRIP